MDSKINIENQTLFSLFFEIVERTCQRHKISDVVVEEYLARVLDRFTMTEDADILDKPLLFEYQDRANHATDISLLREIGDAALWVASMMRPSRKKVLSTSNYVNVGQCAYGLVFSSVPEDNLFRPVFRCFAENLWPYVGILTEVRKEAVFQASESDIIEVWKRYEATKQEEDVLWLQEHGITLFPNPPDSVKKKKASSQRNKNRFLM